MMEFKDTLTLGGGAFTPETITLAGETGEMFVKLEVAGDGGTVVVELDETELIRMMTMLVQAGFALRGTKGGMPFVSAEVRDRSDL